MKTLLLILFPLSLAAQVKISDMPTATYLNGTELVPIVQGGVNKKATTSLFGSGISGSGTANTLTYWSGTLSLGSLPTSTYPSLSELSYVKGVISPIQTQLSNKQDLLTFGLSGQIPFVNATNNGFQYTANFKYDATNKNLFFADVPNTINGTPNNTYILGESMTINGQSGAVTDALVAGFGNTIGDGTSSFSGSEAFSYGSNGKNYGLSSMTGGRNARVLQGGQTLGVLFRTGGIAIGLGDASGSSSSEPITSDAGSVNISANTSAQTAGHGSYGNLSVILGGRNHDIPTTSPRSVILGGDAIKARASEPDQVYIPNLNIVSTPTNDNALTDILVRNTNGAVYTRSVSSLPSGYLLSSGGTATGVNTFTFNSPNQLNVNGTFTATANNQFLGQFGGSLTTRNTNSDILSGYLFNPTISRNVGNPTTQVLYGVRILPSLPSSGTTNYALGINNNLEIANTSITSINFRLQNSTTTYQHVLSSSSYSINNVATGYGITLSSSDITLNSSGSIYLRSQASTSNVFYLGDQTTSPTTARIGASIRGMAPSGVTAYAPTTGISGAVQIGGASNGLGNFQPSSGNASHFVFRLNDFYSQTGTASGAITDLLIDPSLGSVLGDKWGIRYTPTGSYSGVGVNGAIRTDAGSVFIANSSSDALTSSTRFDIRGISGGTNIARFATNSNVLSASIGDVDTQVRHLGGLGSSPTISAGSGAGTSPTLSVVGTDLSGVVTITTGTTPSGSNAIVATITFSTSYTSAPDIVLTPANRNAQSLAFNQIVLVPANGETNGISTSSFIIESGATALNASTTYKFFYHITQ